MATIELSRAEAGRKGLLPRVCMQCGQPADCTEEKRLVWHPPWIFLLILIGLIPFIVVLLITEKKMTLRAPFCEEHRNHWRWRSRVGLFGLLGILLSIGVIFGCFFLPLPEEPRMLIAVLLGLGVGLGTLVWIVACIVAGSSAIKATHISEDSVTLTNVCEEFVDAVDDAYEADPRRYGIAARQYRSSSSISSSSSLIALLVVMGICLLFIVCLVAIGNIGRNAPRPQVFPGPAPGNAAGPAEVVDKEFQFRLKHPGRGWTLLDRAEAQQSDEDALAAATHDELNIYATVFAERVPPKTKLQGYEERQARKAIANLKKELTDVRIVLDVVTIDFLGGKAVRFKLTGTDDDGDVRREQHTLFVRNGILYRLICTGDADTTGPIGAEFLPFEQAFELLPAPQGLEQTAPDPRP